MIFFWLTNLQRLFGTKKKETNRIFGENVDWLPVQFLSDKALIQLPESSADVGSRAIKLGLVSKIAEPNTQSMHIVTQ